MCLDRKNGRRRPWIAPVVLATLVACGGVGPGDNGSGAQWAGTVTDSAGVEIVVNPDSGTWGPQDRWTTTEVLRIGTTGDDPDYQFGQISGIAEMPDGRIVVLDQQAQEVRVFSAAGEHLRTIGGAGSGPGEFGLGAGPLLIGPGDTLVVPDLSNQRVSRFSPEGEPVGSYAMDFAAGLPMAWMDSPGGQIVSQVRPLNLPGQETHDPNDVLVLRGSDGAITDTLMVFPSGGTISFSESGAQLEFFSPEPVWSLAGDGVVFGVNDTYRLGVYGGDGALERVIVKPSEPRPVTEGDQQIMIDAFVGLWKSIGLSGSQLDAAREAIGFADFYPAYALVRAGPAGSIWVQHLQTPDELTPEELAAFDPQSGFGSSTWDVFDPSGRFLGSLDMPDRFQPLRFQGDRIYGIWRDDLDVQYVLILRVEGTEEELVG